MKPWLTLWLLATLAIAGFVSLGRWQLDRAIEKQQMLDAVAAALRDRQPQPLALVPEQAGTGYAWVSSLGTFAPSPALLLDNQRRGDAVGVEVFGVFKPLEGPALLVDLGWLALPGDRALPNIDLPSGQQRLAGMLSPPPASGIALGPAYAASDARRWLLTRIDIDALSAGLNTRLAHRVLRLDPKLPLGYARDLNILPNTLPPERHRGYAVQWFGLAAATFVFALTLSLRRRHS